MKDHIHPQYQECIVCLCGSGNTWKTRSTAPEIRVEKFRQRYEKLGQGEAPK